MAFADLNGELKKPEQAKALTEAGIVAGSLTNQVMLASAELDGGANAARRLAVALELGLANAAALPENITEALTALEEVEAKATDAAIKEREELQKTAQLKAALKAQEAKEKAEVGSNLDRLRAEMLSEEELLIAKNARELELLDMALLADESLRAEHGEIRKAKAKELADSLLGITKKAADDETAIEEAKQRAKLNAISGAFGDLASLMNAGSKKMFKIGKAAALAGAIVDGIAAVQGAIKIGNSVGGPPVGAAFGVAAGIQAAVQVRNIAKQEIGGGSATSFSGGLPAVNTQQSGQGQQQPQNINISGIDRNSLISGGQLVDTLNAALGDGYTINIAGGG